MKKYKKIKTWEFALNLKEIPLKINRTKKKVNQKIALTFNFAREIIFNIFPDIPFGG